MICWSHMCKNVTACNELISVELYENQTIYQSNCVSKQGSWLHFPWSDCGEGMMLSALQLMHSWHSLPIIKNHKHVNASGNICHF